MFAAMKPYIASKTLRTILLISVLIVSLFSFTSNSAEAVHVAVSTSADSVSQGDSITFTTTVSIESTERIPIQTAKLMICSDASCNKELTGSPYLSPRTMTISNINPSTGYFTYGPGYGFDSNLGIGYAFPVGSGYGGYSGVVTLTYQCTITTSNEWAPGVYFARADIDCGTHTFSSTPATFVVTSSTSGGQVIHVDADATGTNSGSSWTNAFNSLQDALDIATSGDQIWVASGTYTPISQTDPINSRTATFQMKNGVAIYGGFDPSAGKDEFTERDWENNVTVLSGDIGVAGDNSDNCYNVFYHPEGTNLDDTAVLDGFIITSGNANGTVDYCDGGGMLNNNSYPTVTNCTFTGNTADWFGGGMYNTNSSPEVTNCKFYGNTARNGGGMFNGNSDATVTNCTFTGNTVETSGGGMCNAESSPEVIDCTFKKNSALRDGGGMFNAILNPTVTNCTFYGNTAPRGGGMYNTNSSPEVSNSIFSDNTANRGGGLTNYHYSSPMVINCTFVGNKVEGYGGGVCNSDISNPTLTNCTFVDNQAVGTPSSTGEIFGRGGGIYNKDSSPDITNCIFWDNMAENSASEIGNDATSAPVIVHSDIAGSNGSGASWDASLGADKGGNIDEHPLLTSDFHLQSTSPCIDSGTNSAANLPVTDFEGDDRIIDGDGDGTGTVDMGADEALSPVYIVVDNLDPDPQFTATGFWNESGANDEFESSSVYTSTAGSTATWTPNLPQPGTYEVYVWWTYHYSGRDTNAPYTINHKNGPDTVRVDQDNPATAGDWYYLGAYEFDAGINGNVTLTREDGAVFTTSADAVRFVSVNLPTPSEVWVDDDYCDTCSNDGHIWDYDAFDTIQEGIEAVSGSTVNVGPGTYYENIAMKSGVHIIGAGAGANPVIHSIIDGGANGSVLTAIDVDSTARLNGFTVTNGSAINGGGMYNLSSYAQVDNCSFINNSGNGMHNENSSPTVDQCVFESNLSGMHNWASSPQVTNCVFDGNSFGGMRNYAISIPKVMDCNFEGNQSIGMFNDVSSPLVDNCTFTDNEIGMSNWLSSPDVSGCTFASNSSDIYGAGMKNSKSSPTISSCTFEANIAFIGAGIYNDESSPIIDDCVFIGNVGSTLPSVGGGGIHNWNSAPIITNSIFEANESAQGGGIYNNKSQPTIVNCVFMGNLAESGAAMLNNNAHATITNCTFEGNVASLGGGALFNTYGATPVVTNSILWNNSPDEIRDEIDAQSAVNHSDVQMSSGIYPGIGNINKDPLLIPGYHLSPISPCIDAGNNSAQSLPTIDFEGDARIIDGDGNGTSIVDMGADEAPYTPPMPVEIIIDNQDAEFSTNGAWSESGADGEYNGSSVYTATTGYSATWTPNITEAGCYEVYAWWTYHYSGRDTNAPYTINHKNGADTVRVDQNDPITAGDWYLLGTYEFNAGIGGNVTLTREAGANGSTSADAVRFVKTDCVINPLDITTTSLSSGQQGTYYSDTVSASGGVPPYAWSVCTGSLPTGLNLDTTTGEIYGTPTIQDTFNFTICISDSQGPPETDSQPLSITIDPPAPVEVIIDNLDTEFSTNGVWSESGADGEYNGSSVYTATIGYSATWTPNLPEAGCYEVYAWWTYHYSGRDIDAPYTINHKYGSNTIGVNQDNPAIGGDWYYLGTYEFNSGVSGNVTLTREAGANGSTSADAVRFVKTDCVVNPLDITTSSLSSGQQGTYYSDEVSATGGVPPYAWSVCTGSLPTGLNLDTATGEIYGTPATQDTFNFTICISDSQGPPETDSQPLSIAIDPPAPVEVIIDNQDPGFITYDTWSESSASGEYNGSSVYTATAGYTANWTPDLPESGCYDVYAWWTYHTSGRDTSAPYTIHHKNGFDTIPVDQNDPVTAGDWYYLGTFEFNAGTGGNVNLTREAGAIGTTSADAVKFVKTECVINPLDITTSSLAFGQEGTYYSDMVTATGGVPPYAWSVCTGSLPTGLNLDTATGEIYGTPTVQDILNFTICVSDSQGPADTDSEPLSIIIDPPAPVEVIIDNLDTGFSTNGAWSESGSDGEYNGSSVYTATTGYTATWTPNLPEAGTYEVYAWWTYHYSGRDINAPYTINHKNGSATIRVDQNDPLTAGDWYYLGTYEFNSGVNGNVTLTREDEAIGTTSADAVRLIRIGD